MGNVPIIYAVTVPKSLIYFTGLFPYLSKNGFTVHVISGKNETIADEDFLDPKIWTQQQHAEYHEIDMYRGIAPWKDLSCIGNWRTIIKKIQPKIVHVHTPKASLLGMLASCMERVPIRIYHIHGCRYYASRGIARLLLQQMERCIIKMSTKTFLVSNSLRNYYIHELKISNEEKLALVENGIDCSIFDPDQFTSDDPENFRNKLGIPKDSFVIGFAGRLVVDKGINELLLAFQELSKKYSHIHLFLAGSIEKLNALSPQAVDFIKNGNDHTHLLGYIRDMPRFYSSIDLLVSPTYREGFGLTLAEANAMMKPVVSSNIVGCVDAIENGVTGMLVPVKDVKSIIAAIERYIRDPELRRQHGMNGRERVKSMFSPALAREGILNAYVNLLNAREH